MELLPQGTQNTNQVTFDDQQQINKFSTLMTHYDRLKDKLKQLESDKEQIDDVTLELELVDEDELVDYLIGGEIPSDVANEAGAIIGDGCFVKLKQSKVMENLELKSNEINDQIDNINNELENLSSVLSSLKSTLYAKFGNAINLEK
jgi:prefoldin subunit 4